MEDENSKRRELEGAALEKVGEVISTVKKAKQVDEVICALHSIATLLFPLDPSLLVGSFLIAIYCFLGYSSAFPVFSCGGFISVNKE